METEYKMKPSSFIKKGFGLLFLFFLIMTITSCHHASQLVYQIGTQAVEYGNVIYYTDKQSNTIRSYDLASEVGTVLLEGVEVDSLALDWPNLWMIEGGSRLLKFDLGSRTKYTIYSSEQGLNGLLFLYGDSVFFEESIDDINVNCQKLNKETGNCTLFLKNSNIRLNFHLAFYQNLLFFTSTAGSTFCVEMNSNLVPQMVDADPWFTMIGTDSGIYYSKYVDGRMQTLLYGENESELALGNYSFLQVKGEIENTLFLEAKREQQDILLQWNQNETSVVFEDCTQFVYSDEKSVFYYLASGILFWSNKNCVDCGQPSKSSYYIILYDPNNQHYMLIDEIEKASP